MQPILALLYVILCTFIMHLNPGTSQQIANKAQNPHKAQNPTTPETDSLYQQISYLHHINNHQNHLLSPVPSLVAVSVMHLFLAV